jgi:hypothetical protein
MVFAWVQNKTTYDEPSLMPEELNNTSHLNIQKHDI